jgi:hypothetical protein
MTTPPLPAYNIMRYKHQHHSSLIIERHKL